MMMIDSSIPRTPLSFFTDTATTEIYTLSLHDALPISQRAGGEALQEGSRKDGARSRGDPADDLRGRDARLPAGGAAGARRVRRATRALLLHAGPAARVLRRRREEGSQAGVRAAGRPVASGRPGSRDRPAPHRLLAGAAGAPRPGAPAPERQPRPGPPLQRVRRPGDLEPQEPPRHAQGREPAHGALLPARGTRPEPGPAADRPDLPAGLDREVARHPDRGRLADLPRS